MTSILSLLQSATASHTDSTTIVFIAAVLLMLLTGRLLGELMRRIGQPEVLGQLVAGIVLGPTVFGNLMPATHHFFFPNTPETKKMIDAISQLGILMLLLLAGMEIDFALVKKQKRKALFASLSGIIVPFACGIGLGSLLSASLLPSPGRRLLTTLFLATALSISSVKIVAMVLMEVDFLRRNIGQLILASAIIDDTIGWIIVAIISGIAAEGAIDLSGLALTVALTVLFLALSFTFGRTVITYIIRWTNDNLQIEFSVLSMILAFMCLLSILTDRIGVHSVLGAFVAGILVGQSPMMTEHIRDQLRGLVIGLFAPIFFAVAGLSVDITILRDPSKLMLAVVLILIASVGKLGGCFTGGIIGGLAKPEALALAVGMNARGTTEVIVATIGLAIGVLSQDFYTLIVVMAVTTTMIMPPTLRWALRRIPTSADEKERLEKEQAEAKDFLPHIERLLIAADESECGKLSALLGGLFVGSRKILATALDLERSDKTESQPESGAAQLPDRVEVAITAAVGHRPRRRKKNSEDEKAPPPAQLNTKSSTEEPVHAILKELANGYDMIFVGLEGALELRNKKSSAFSSSIEPIFRDFEGALAIAIARSNGAPLDSGSISILLPATGTDYSRRAAEVSIAIAKASSGVVTALNVSPPPAQTFITRANRKHLKPGRDLLRDIKRIGMREGVRVRTVVEVRREVEAAIINRVKKGNYNLVVIGANLRPADGIFFGHSVKVLVEQLPCDVLVVSS